MITFADLRSRFGEPRNVAPYGDCLVIPGSKFDPDWEAELGDQGFKCHFTDLDGHAVTLVQVKISVPHGKVVYVPPPKSAAVSVPEFIEEKKEIGKQNKGNPHPTMSWLKDAEFWSPEEDSLIIELWKKKRPLAEISAEVHMKYPKRSEKAAVVHRVYVLQGKGLIEKRRKPKVHGNLEAKEMSETKRKVGWESRWKPEEDKVLLDAVGDRKFGANRLIVPVLDKLPGRSLDACLWRVGVLRKQEAAKGKSVEPAPAGATLAASELERKVALLQDSVDTLIKVVEDQKITVQKELENVVNALVERATVEDLDALEKKLNSHLHAQFTGQTVWPPMEEASS